MAAPRVSFDDACQDRFGAPPPALPLAQQPVLELQIVVQVQALQELAAQQLGRLPPTFFRFLLQQCVRVNGHVG